MNANNVSHSEISLWGKFDDLPIYWGEEFFDEFDDEPECWFFVQLPGDRLYTKVKSLNHAFSIALGKIINSPQQCDTTAEDFVLATKPQRIFSFYDYDEILNRYQMGIMQAMLLCGWNRFIAV